MSARRDHALQPVYVWDLPTRLFHWSLVAAVATALYTGFLAPESWLGVHRAAGYAAAGLVAFRLVWWRYGSGYSRFSSLLKAIRDLPQFVPALAKLKPPHSRGHNPAGSLMIVALVAVVALLTLSGFVVEGGYEKRGALAGLVSFATGAALRQLHEALAVALMAMIALHVAGVAVESLLLRVSLVRAMISGWLPLPPLHDRAPAASAEPVRASLALAAAGTVVAGGLAVLLPLSPKGIPAMEHNGAFAEECSACHMLYHPSLLPRASWSAMIADLPNHFGEDASLDPALAGEIAAYLDRYAAESWDSEAANLLRRTSPEDPLRIVASPYWVRKHAGIAAAAFAAPPVKSKSNCAACHGDAATGRFDDQAINVPNRTDRGA